MIVLRKHVFMGFAAIFILGWSIKPIVGSQAGNSIGYKKSMYPATIQSEIARWRKRMAKEMGKSKLVKQIAKIIKAGEELRGFAKMSFRLNQGLKGQEFIRLSSTYYHLKIKVIMDMEMEYAHLNAYIGRIQGIPENKEEVKFWKKVLKIYQDGVKHQKLANMTRVRRLQAEALAQIQWVEKWRYKAGSFRNLGPDTARGDFLLRRFEKNPYVAGVNLRK